MTACGRDLRRRLPYFFSDASALHSASMSFEFALTASSTRLVALFTSRDTSCRTSRMTRFPTAADSPLPEFRRDLYLVMDSRGDTLNQVLYSLVEIIELDKELADILSAQELDNHSTAA